MMVSGPYGGFWRTLRRATTFWFRDRSRRRWRHHGKVDNEIPVVGHRPPVRRPHWAVALLGLVVPALAVTLLGLWSLKRAIDFGYWHLGNGVETALWVGATVAMMARSLSATAPLWVRIVAFAVSVPYPVALVIADFFGPL